MTRRFVGLLALIFVLFSGLPVASASADALTHQIVVGDVDVLNAWPGPDGEIGTGDDVVSAIPSPINDSAPNSIGSYSYNAFDFGGGTPESALLPDPMDAITFLEGTVVVDSVVGASGGGAIITEMNVMGTEPFIGHGAYDAQILAINSGTYNSTTKAFTLDVDFTTTLVVGTAEAIGFALSGTAYFVDLMAPVGGTGNDYVDNVLVPLAQARGAGSLFYMRATGTVPQSTGGTGGSFPSFPIEAAIVALPEPSAFLMNLTGLAVLVVMRRALGNRCSSGASG